MVKASPGISSVNSGEFSPAMSARVDFDRYPSGASLFRNMIARISGAGERRPGTKFIGATKTAASASRLIPFVFSQNDAYMLEFGANYMRVYRDQARTDAEDVGSTITNGDFASDISGWTDQSTGSAAISWDSGTASMKILNATDGIGVAEQAPTTSTTSTEHILKFTVDGDLGVKVRLRVGSSSGGEQYLADTELGTGKHAIAFTPTASPYYIQFRRDHREVEAVYIDDVSIADDAALELVTPYAAADIGPDNLRFVQTADVLYLFHPSYRPMKVERRGDTSWSIVDVLWSDGPWGDMNPVTPDLSDWQIVKNPLFENGIQNWSEVSGTGGSAKHDSSQNIVELLDSTGSAVAKIEQAVSTGVTTSTNFIMHINVVGTKESSSARAVKYQIGTTSGGTEIKGLTTLNPGWVTTEFTTSAATIYVRIQGNGYQQSMGIGGCLIYPQTANTIEADGASGSVTITANGAANVFASTDVGRLLRMEYPGNEPVVLVITGYTNSKTVTARFRRKTEAAITDLPTERWWLGSWSDTTGWPAVATFFENRVICGRTTKQPQTIWMSQSGDFENMRPDSWVEGAVQTEDDDALDYTIASAKVNDIQWMIGSRRLIIGTAGGQWVATSQGAALTASDISITKHSSVACANLPAIEIDNVALFSDIGKRDFYDLGFSFESDGFIPSSLTVIADHIARGSIADIAYQQRPWSMAYCLLDDGRIATLSYNRAHSVVGWSLWTIAGTFSTGDAVVESIAVIPGADGGGRDYDSGDRDELWMIVKRTVDGNTRRDIEILEGGFEGPLRADYTTEALWRTAVKDAMDEAFYVDAGIVYSGSATDTITGLDHLEGETVTVLADGKVHPDCTVSSGSITLDYTASRVHAGLAYKHRYESLRLPYGTRSGSGLTKSKKIVQLGMVLLDSGTFEVTTTAYDDTGRRVPTLQTQTFALDGDAMDEATPLFTGERVITPDRMHTTDARIYIEGDAPLPFNVLALVPIVDAGER